MVQTPQYLQNNTTVGEWLDNWLTTYMQHTLKQSTYKSYETYVRKHFKPSLGSIKLKELDSAYAPDILQLQAGAGKIVTQNDFQSEYVLT